MSLLAQPWVIKTRNRIRNSDLVRALYSRWKANFDYEERFGHVLLEAVGAETFVWDVGANIGLYTEKFLAKGAHVVCFEPAPSALEILRTKFATELSERVMIVPAALSDTCGTAPMSTDGASPTNQLRVGASDEGLVKVSIMRADDLIRNQRVRSPTVIKIDVEGYELEVLRGFGDLLDSKELRAVFIEVHFRLLHERGLDHAPEEISSRLTQAGFKVRWLDLSHICGIRA
jgi:FkbM family methyltransferase